MIYVLVTVWLILDLQSIFVYLANSCQYFQSIICVNFFFNSSEDN